MKRILGLFLLVFLGIMLSCSKATTTLNTQSTDIFTTSIGQTTNQETTLDLLTVSTNPYCNCGFYQQRPFEISLTLSQIIDELDSRGYYFINYTDDYYAYFPEDLLALEQRDYEWYNVTVKYEEIITAYYDTDYGQLQIDIFQMESSLMASDLANGYFLTENCFSGVVIYSEDIIIRMFWYFEDLLNEWEIDPSC